VARIILKSPYLKPNAKTHAANYVKYIATRDGVERPQDDKLRHFSATQFQQKTVAQLLKDYPDTTELYEYEDFLKKPTRQNAEEFIIRAAETHAEMFGARERYVDYIATRPGAVHVAGHGLFGDADKPVILDHVMDEVKNHTGNVWCHIISLRREDAERLGYDSVSAWQELLRSQRNTIAAAMNIRPENFRWYAAFHDKEHHPHIHLVAWSAKPSEPWLSEDGIGKIKASLAKQIFKNDLLQIYDRQTEHRDALRQDSRELAAEIVRQINSGGYDNPVVEDLLVKLADRLNNLSGKKVYGYLPPDATATVDLIVDELAKDGRIAALYDLWYEQRQAVVSTYTDKLVERLPLSQNDDFKPVKNAVIKEARNIVLGRLTFEDAAMDDDEADDLEQTDQEPDAPEPTPPPETNDTGEPKNADNKYTLYRRAKKLLDKDSSEFDPQAAIPLLLQSAQQDYEWAQYRLGKIFLTGDPVERDAEYGLRWLREAEAQNNQYAQILLGRTYLKGELAEQDIATAETLFEKAAVQGNTTAQYTLAKMHFAGQTANPSVIRAVELLEAAAAQNHEWAQYNLGKLLMRGDQIPKDVLRAEKLLLAVVQPRLKYDGSGTNPHNQYAAYLLGKLYLSEDGIPKDVAKAARFFAEAAEQRNQYAQYQLGKMLLYGKEIERDTATGIALLSASAAQGNQYAQMVLDGYYRFQGNAKVSAAIGSLRLLGRLSQIMKNRLDEETRRDGSVGLIDRKIRRQIEEKKQAHGMRGYE
jgi:TPR repeat protein